jgi:type II secretory pathway pseudopilin PulG
VFRRLHQQRGITIIETTVILAVMFILAGAMSPIVSESISTARAVKAKNDAGMIAMGLVNFQKDVGGDALGIGGATTALAQALGLPDVLETDGASPAATEKDDTPADAVADSPLQVLTTGLRSTGNGAGTPQSLRRLRRQWREVAAGSLDDHLTTNRMGYRERRPGEYTGWAGPYVSTQLRGDPWGNQYLINSHWLDGGTTPADAQGRTRSAVFVVSAGANGALETPYDQPVTDAKAYGDDIVIRIQ